MFVVRGCVPAGEALGNGVTTTVGCGEAVTWLMVAVGRGPAGMLGLGSGEAESSGDCPRRSVQLRKKNAEISRLFISKASRLRACPAVKPSLA